MDQPMPIVRSAVVMQSAAERAVDVAGLKPLTVRVQATDFKVVWTSDY